MPIQLNLENPEYYLERIKTGCILDPSVFYSEEYVNATILLISSIRPKEVYLPQHLFVGLTKGNWRSFLSTMELWTSAYEKLPSAWYSTDLLLTELSPKPIELLQEDDETELLFKAMSKKGKLSPLNRMLYEMSAISLKQSIPIYVGSHSKIRLLELLNSKLNTVVISPLGGWAENKKRYLSKKSHLAVLALTSMGGAFVFISSIGLASAPGLVGSGLILVATLIDGS